MRSPCKRMDWPASDTVANAVPAGAAYFFRCGDCQLTWVIIHSLPYLAINR